MGGKDDDDDVCGRGHKLVFVVITFRKRQEKIRM